MNWDTNPFAVAWKDKLSGKTGEMEYIEGEVEKLQECEMDTI